MIDVRCYSCGNLGAVNRVTAGLTCRCGSTDIDVFDPAELGFFEMMAAAHGPGTGWDVARPDPLKGWSEYAGPMPGKNPGWGHEAPSSVPCSNCHGSGRSLREVCRACGGSGRRTPPTTVEPAPQVAKHPGQTSTPFMGQRRQAGGAGVKSPHDVAAPGRELRSPEDVIKHTTPGWSVGDGITDPDAKMPNVSPHLKTRDDAASGEKYSEKALRERRSMGYPMHEAECPECGHSPTHLVNDYKDEAWWHCKNCGPLTNIDRHPEVDPYNPPHDFTPSPRSYSDKPPKTGRRQSEKTGRVLGMLHTVSHANPGLSGREALGIVRATVSKYSE